ncbi:MAG: anti-sigma factor [Rhodospirillaceae bacterium]|nr:anti-sigma factor [Rhodospirillaceae bacterium]
MSGPEAEPSDDAALVAYLDGALAAAERSALEARLATDAALAGRLARLRPGGRDFAAAFELLLLAAPRERLAERLARAEAATARRRARERRVRRLLPAAAVVLLLLVGAAAGHLVPRLLAPGEEPAVAEGSPDYWRQAVAEYLTLYTRDTLADIPDDPALRARELDTVGARLSLALDPAALALPGLSLKRAQILALDGRPLAQIAYLSERDGPVAFCIIADGQRDAGRRFEERLGRGIVYWSKGGRGYMVIGAAPRDALEAYAATLDARIS